MDLLSILIWYAVFGIVWMLICKNLAEAKGYINEGWSLWGFLFGVFALIVLLIKPNQNIQQPQNIQSPQGNTQGQYQQSIVHKSNLNTWKCANCGSINNENLITCSCGMNKRQSAETFKQIALQKNKKQEDDAIKSEADKLDMIKKYKELLDMGAITEEEFNKKKESLLNDATAEQKSGTWKCDNCGSENNLDTKCCKNCGKIKM